MTELAVNLQKFCCLCGRVVGTLDLKEKVWKLSSIFGGVESTLRFGRIMSAQTGQPNKQSEFKSPSGPRACLFVLLCEQSLLNTGKMWCFVGTTRRVKRQGKYFFL